MNGIDPLKDKDENILKAKSYGVKNGRNDLYLSDHFGVVSIINFLE